MDTSLLFDFCSETGGSTRQTRTNEAIIEASANGHADVVRLLMRNKWVNPAEDESQALHLACKGGHLEVVQLLMQDKRMGPTEKNNISFR